MKLAIIISIWRRHDLTKIVLDYYRELKKKYNLEVIIAGSEGEESRKLAKGLTYIEVNNYPLTEKNNALLLKAKELNVDGVILLGSDDLINKKVLDFYFNLSPDKKEMVGFNDIYFYSTHTKSLTYFKYDCIRTVGAGRFFSRYVLDKMDWRLWRGTQQRGLDKNCQEYLFSKGITEEIFNLAELNGVIIDIKHEDNITSHSIAENGEKVNIKIFETMGRKVKNKIEKLQPLPTKKVISVHQEKVIIDELYVKGIGWDSLPQEVVVTVKQDSKHLKAGQEYTLTKDHAKILVQKGLVKLK